VKKQERRVRPSYLSLLKRREDVPVQLLLPKVSDDALRRSHVLISIVSADAVLVASVVLQ